MLKTSAILTLYGGQFTFSTQLLALNYLNWCKIEKKRATFPQTAHTFGQFQSTLCDVDNTHLTYTGDCVDNLQLYSQLVESKQTYAKYD